MTGEKRAGRGLQCSIERPGYFAVYLGSQVKPSRTAQLLQSINGDRPFRQNSSNSVPDRHVGRLASFEPTLALRSGRLEQAFRVQRTLWSVLMLEVHVSVASFGELTDLSRQNVAVAD
jgi:hypothetical protein